MPHYFREWLATLTPEEVWDFFLYCCDRSCGSAVVPYDIASAAEKAIQAKGHHLPDKWRG